MDPIADMLTRIRNAQMVSKPDVLIPYSNIKYAIAQILEKKQFVEKVEKVGKKRKQIKVTIAYVDSTPRIRGLKRISKQGQRIYRKVEDMRSVRRGYGVGIVSTSQGILTTEEARRKNIGGEVICEIW